MKHLTLILFLWSSFTFAQKSEVFRIDSLPKEGIVLDKGWKWHAGDNAEWAKVGYDDVGWEGIDPTKEITKLPQIGMAKIGYLRLNFYIDSTLVGKALAMEINQTTASEIYLNNHLIHKLGVVSKNPKLEQILLPNGQLFSLIFQKLGFQTLVVRYSLANPPIFLKHKPLHFSCFSAKLVFSDKSIQSFAKHKNDYALRNYLKIGIYILLFLIHFFFFVSFPAQKANLFICLYGLCNIVVFHCENLICNLPVSAHDHFFYESTLYISSIFVALFSLLTVYSYLQIPKKSIFWIVFMVSVFSYPISLYAPDFGVFYFHFILTSSLAIESIRVSIKGLGNKKPGAWFIVAGWIGYILFVGCFFLAVFGIITLDDFWRELSINLALVSVPICLSLMLANDYANTTKTLAQKLTELNTLAEEKQQLLAAQNETLERQVTTRTAELNQSLETLKATQAQLIEREKLASLGELTAGIAHEIQNPLNFVNNFAEVSTELIDEMTEELGKGNQVEADTIAQDLKQNLEKINYHGKRASSIVKNMLEHSRTNAGHKESTDINTLIDECLRLSYHGMRGQFRNFQADYGLNLASHLPSTKVVKQDLGRVLLNLFNNAFYAVHERMKQLEGTQHHDYVPKVSASTSKLKNGIEIRIKDNGTGIPEALKKKIFQPFFTTKPTGEGTGLGLSLSYEIITKGHGGRLSIESVEGMGTTFIIELPFEPKT